MTNHKERNMNTKSAMTQKAIIACYLAAWKRAEANVDRWDIYRDARRDEDAWLARLADAVGGYPEACAVIVAEYELSK
jgi:hypothetical protein